MFKPHSCRVSDFVLLKEREVGIVPDLVLRPHVFDEGTGAARCGVGAKSPRVTATATVGDGGRAAMRRTPCRGECRTAADRPEAVGVEQSVGIGHMCGCVWVA